MSGGCGCSFKFKIQISFSSPYFILFCHLNPAISFLSSNFSFLSPTAEDLDVHTTLNPQQLDELFGWFSFRIFSLCVLNLFLALNCKAMTISSDRIQRLWFLHVLAAQLLNMPLGRSQSSEREEVANRPQEATVCTRETWQDCPLWAGKHFSFCKLTEPLLQWETIICQRRMPIFKKCFTSFPL